MLGDITLGQYYPGNSPVHRMDPRSKLLLTIAYIVGVFLISNLPGYLLALGFLWIVVRVSGIRFSYLLRGLKPLRFILLFTFILNVLFSQGTTTLLSIAFFRLTREGLENAVYFSLRLVFLVMGTSVLTLTTSPVQLTDALEHLMHPLACFGFPAHELAMMMTIALRFIPTLLNETDRILKAQLARGADLDRGSIMKRMKAFIPVLVPLFVIVFQTADDLAIAMEARCYRGGEGRTRMKPFNWRLADTAALLFCAALIVGQKLLNWYAG